MRFSDFLNNERLNEGGNVYVTNRKGESSFADQIDLQKFHVLEFREQFLKLFSELNKLYQRKFNKEKLWSSDSDIRSGLVFNGSTSYIMNPEISHEEILKYKKKAGDVDIMIPKDSMRNLWILLKSLEEERIAGFTYFGNNRNDISKLGTQINAIFVYHHKEGDIKCQVDFEASDFENGKPTEWSKFSHGSSFEDAKSDIKALHHKLLLRSLVGAISRNPEILIATPKSTPDKITIKKNSEVARMAQFSVDYGLGFGLKPLLDSNGEQVFYDGKAVWLEKEQKEKEYINNLDKIFEYIFKMKIAPKSFYSFKGIVSLMKKYCDNDTIRYTHERYFETLWGKGGQVIDSFSPENDCKIKLNGFNYFLDSLNLKHPLLDKEIQKYYDARKSAFRKL